MRARLRALSLKRAMTTRDSKTSFWFHAWHLFGQISGKLPKLPAPVRPICPPGIALTSLCPWFTWSSQKFHLQFWFITLLMDLGYTDGGTLSLEDSHRVLGWKQQPSPPRKHYAHLKLMNTSLLLPQRDRSRPKFRDLAPNMPGALVRQQPLWEVGFGFHWCLRWNRRFLSGSSGHGAAPLLDQDLMRTPH